MMPVGSTRQASDALFLAIAHPVRREILDLAASSDELPLSALRAHFPQLSFSALVQQLNVLRGAGLLADRREGRNVFVRLTPGPLLEVIDWMLSFEARARPRLDALGAFLDSSREAPRAQPPNTSVKPRTRRGRPTERTTRSSRR